MTDTKATNPKEDFGSAKVPVGLVPDTAIIEEAMAFLEGALKYGRFNWRIAGVKASTYHDAIERHLKKWWNGQDRDPLTRVMELASVRACCGILIDSTILGMLNDDRPPQAPVGEHLDASIEHVAFLKELFAGHKPHQYTWRDNPIDFEDAPEIELTPDTPAPVEEPTPPLPPLPPLLPPVLKLSCGCVKRCKGHEYKMELVPPEILAQSAYAAERAPTGVPPGTQDPPMPEWFGPALIAAQAADAAAGPRDPLGRPYRQVEDLPASGPDPKVIAGD